MLYAHCQIESEFFSVDEKIYFAVRVCKERVPSSISVASVRRKLRETTEPCYGMSHQRTMHFLAY